MKLNLRALVLAGIFAAATAVTAVPAHATVGGSSPRPAPGSWRTSVVFYSTILSTFGL